MSQHYTVNDWVVYHESEFSTHPTPEAHDVRPAEHGELYSYVVDRFLRVVRVNPDGTIDAVSASGRAHHVAISDPQLEKVGWWNRLFRRRFFAGW
jgi:hypothetical protein